MRKVVWGIFSTLFLVLISLPALGGDCDRAREYYEKAQKMKVSQNPTLVLIKKEQLYKKAIKLCPDYAKAHNNLGDVYEKQGRFEEAIAEYNKAIELAPEAPYAYFGLGDIYYKTRPAEAKKWYEEGLKYAPTDALTNRRLALVSDIQKSGVIKAETIRGMLSTTRGPGEVVSISFGEGLIPFDFDKYNIRPDAKPQLDEIGRALKGLLASSKDISVERRKMPVIEIAGHTDIRGMDEYNLRLSKNRAESVVNYLVYNFNIPKEGLMPKGYGERVPLCGTGDTKPCHALNRRVEIVKKPGSGVKTRSVSFRGVANEPEVVMDVGFFYQENGERRIKVLKEDSRLRSRSDKYFIFLRPAQDCYAYIIQEDSRGSIDLIFPKDRRDAYVKKGSDYWVPGFGRAYRLDDTKGEEKLYLLVTSWALESEIEELTLKEQVRGAIRALKTRTIYVVRPSNAPEHVQEDELHKKPQKIDQLLARIEGKGGWVKVVKFLHE